jgi:hypothetical protein
MFRFVVVLALLAVCSAAPEINSRIVTTWTNGCPLAQNICNMIATLSPFGFPNIGGFQSVAFNKTSQGLQSDSLVSVITTMGMPATWLAYYSVQSSFQFSLNWSNLFNTNNPDTSASFSASTYATGMAFPRLIEFDDVNGNRVYDIDVDTVVSTYEFVDATTLLPRRWQMMTQTSKSAVADSGANATLYTFCATTSDNVVTIQWTTSDAQVTTDAGFISPNNTKIDLKIVNFPYVKNTTFLAVESLLTGLTALIDAASSTQDGVNLGDKGRVDWVKLADATASGSRKMNVLASSMTKQTSAVLGQSLFAAAVTHQAGVTYNRIFYSFDQANAKYIFWDPSVGYGMPALAPTQTVWSAMVISLVVAFSLLAVGSALIYFNRDRIRQSDFVQSRSWLKSVFSVNNEYIAMPDAGSKA